MLILGSMLLPLGIWFFIASHNLVEIQLDYTSCRAQPKDEPISDDFAFVQCKYDPERRNCTLEFQLNKDMPGPIYLYYQLDGYYQNYRKYVSSVCHRQLKGSNQTDSVTLEKCDPLIHERDGSKLPYYPCGSIAAGMFLDRIELELIRNSNGQDETAYSFSDRNIALEVDRRNFQPPDYRSQITAIPSEWVSRHEYEFKYNPNSVSSSSELEKISSDPHFQVWMRTSPFSSFRKLYGIGGDKTGIRAGRYKISVKEWSDWNAYKVKKSIVLTNLSFLGAKNPSLGIAYIVIGALLILLALLFFITNRIHPREVGDCNYLPWNQEKIEAAKATQFLYKVFSTADEDQ